MFYPFLSKMLPLSVCSFLCLHLQGFALSLAQVGKFVVEFCTFFKTDKFSMEKKKQNLLQIWDCLLSRAV